MHEGCGLGTGDGVREGGGLGMGDGVQDTLHICTCICVSSVEVTHIEDPK